MKTVAVLVFMALVIAAISHRMHPLSDEFIDSINSKQTLWKAGRNFHRHTPLQYLKRLTGTIKVNSSVDDAFFSKPPRYKHTLLPSNFDARNKWGHCNNTLNVIRDQGACGSCWAVAAASAMSDRLCIWSNGTEDHYFSEIDIMSCCMNCGSPCAAGGYVERAWIYGQSKGIVTGGKFHSDVGCKPYTIAPCEHNNPFQSKRSRCNFYTPKTVCTKRCEKGSNKEYSKDKRKLAKSYRIKDITAVMADILNNGPVTVVFSVFEDFFTYKSGVYKHTKGKIVGNHSVKLLGWGVEKRVKYWLAANSWNEDWGDKGFFKILRGENHMDIERVAHAGLFKKKTPVNPNIRLQLIAQKS